MIFFLKFIYSEKATKFCEISTVVVPVKSTVVISQNCVAFSEYMYELYLNACLLTTNRQLIKPNDEREARGKTLYAGPPESKKSW